MPLSSWQPFPSTSAPRRKPTEPPEDTPVDVESLDTPAPSTSCLHESVHPVQFGIMPKRLPLPHPDDEILSGHEEDVSSIQDGYTAWVMTDPELILERHLVSKSGAMTIYRDSHDRRHSSPNPEYRFINDVPNRLLEQTRLSILNWRTSTRQRRRHRKPHRGEMAHHCSARGK